MKTQIIAMGGSTMYARDEKFLLEKYILEQSPKENPRICFLPTATGDADQSIVRFYEVFAHFQCQRTHLSLFNPPKEYESILMQQDVIYVSGGNTRNLLALWRTWGLDKILYNAWQKGVVLAGYSAGAICWFEEGVSDYIPSELNRLEALGFLTGSHCPHYNSESNRRPRYQELVAAKQIKPGIAADDGVGLHYIDAQLARIVSATTAGRAYQLKNTKHLEEIELMPNIFL